MKRLSFRSRLSLWLTAAVAGLLAVATFGAHWALSRLVLGQLDAALVALAETEASALEADPGKAVRVHELSPGSAPPSFVRLDRFVQIIDPEGRVLARSANLGTANLPAPRAMLDELQSGGVEVSLTPKEYAILEVLMRHAGQVVTRTRLGETVWRDEPEDLANLVDVHVSHLRRKIDHGDRPAMIHTVRGRGFRLGGREA